MRARVNKIAAACNHRGAAGSYCALTGLDPLQSEFEPAVAGGVAIPVLFELVGALFVRVRGRSGTFRCPVFQGVERWDSWGIHPLSSLQNAQFQKILGTVDRNPPLRIAG